MTRIRDMATNRYTLSTLYALKADLLKAFTHINSNLDEHIRRLEEVVQNTDGWTTIGNTAKTSNRPFAEAKTQSPPPITTQNRFSVLDYYNEFPCLPNPHHPRPSSTRPFTNQRKQASKRKVTNTRRVAQTGSPENKDIPTEPIKKVLILADSHGRQISSLLSEKLPTNFSAMCVFKPNGRFADVSSELDTHTKTLTKRDTVIIIGGQNDINLGGHFTPEEHVDKRPAQNTNIVVSTLPFWYNKPTVCKEISHANNQLKLHLRDTHVKLFELNFLSEKHFTRHGLHLNLVGKHALGSELAKHIISQTWQCPAQDPSPPTSPSSLPGTPLGPITLSPEPNPCITSPTIHSSTSVTPPSSPLVTAGTRYFLRPRTRGKNEINK